MGLERNPKFGSFSLRQPKGEFELNFFKQKWKKNTTRGCYYFRVACWQLFHGGSKFLFSFILIGRWPSLILHTSKSQNPNTCSIWGLPLHKQKKVNFFLLIFTYILIELRFKFLQILHTSSTSQSPNLCSIWGPMWKQLEGSKFILLILQ